MKQTVYLPGGRFEWNLKHYHSLAIPFVTGVDHVNAWYVPPIEKKPFTKGDFIGSVASGSSVNFFDIKLNPHGNGTHTECLGHITKENESIKDVVIDPLISAQLITVEPDQKDGDLVISKEQIASKVDLTIPESLIIRTIPNTLEKLNMQYTGANPAYLSEEASLYIHDIGIKHLLIDTPSVDKEEDGGKLLAHKAFWGFHKIRRNDCTISEMIFVPNDVLDGLYLLNLQVLPLENDASPSNPVIFPLTKVS
jgi:kynurenine formamidase